MSGFTFSFRPRFVNPIRAGLGLEDYAAPRFPPSAGMKKRQTIRLERKDEKRPRVGDEAILYTGMRTKGCQIVVPRQTAFVTRVEGITLRFDANSGTLIYVGIGDSKTDIDTEEFARADGFANVDEMSEFWQIEHPGTTKFAGFITFWEPNL